MLSKTRRRVAAAWIAVTCAAVLAGADDVQVSTPAAQDYCRFVLDACDRVQAGLTNTIRVAELTAERHLAGGVIGTVHNYQGFDGELMGRSGGLVHIGVGRPHKKDRSEAEKAEDMCFVGWQRAPTGNELKQMEKLKAKGVYTMGFGPAGMPELAACRALCDMWFDTGIGAADGVVVLPDGSRAGRGNLLVDMLNGWCYIGEFVAALTRHGRMPPMWKAYLYEDGPEWGRKYLGVMQFHDDYTVPPVAAGELSRRYLDRIRELVREFRESQLTNVESTVLHIVRERRAGRKTVVASMGHAAWTFVGRYEDAAWCVNADLHSNIAPQVKKYRETTPDGALVLRLGYCGTTALEQELYREKQQRVMLISIPTPREGEHSAFLGTELRGVPDDALTFVNMGYAFGDACVELEGYPIRILPPSGIMQILAYECINVEALWRLAKP